MCMPALQPLLTPSRQPSSSSSSPSRIQVQVSAREASMGCGGSKPEMARENLQPGFFQTQRKSMEVGIASSTDLLCSEDADGEYDLIAEEEEGRKKLAAIEAVEEAATVESEEEEEEEKGKRLWRPVTDDEQLPGSPSFRFYFAGLGDDGSVILQRDTETGKQTLDGSKHKSQPLNEDFDTRRGKAKAKRKSKLRALTKAPMIHILNARSYSKVAHVRDHQVV